MYSKKFKLVISSTGATSDNIRTLLEPKYKILYCGIYSLNEEVYVYIQNKTRMAWTVIAKLLGGEIDIKDVAMYSKIEGEPMCQTGTIPKHGGKRVWKRPTSNTVSPTTTNIDNTDNRVTINDNSVNSDNRVAISNYFPVALNPIGSETTGHISSDDINSCFDDTTYNGAIVNFSDHLYRVKENLNIRCGSKSSICRAYTKNGWRSEHKDGVYDSIYDNLTSKSLEVMKEHRADVPNELIEKHENDIEVMRQLKVDPEDITPTYLQIRNSSLNLMGENINNRIRNYQDRTGKRLKFT